MTHTVSTAKSSSGSILHPEHCTVYITHCTYTRKCPWTWTCTLHITHWTLYTAHHMFILHFTDVSLHTANIQNLPELVSRFTWQNVPWFIKLTKKSILTIKKKQIMIFFTIELYTISHGSGYTNVKYCRLLKPNKFHIRENTKPLNVCG